MTATISVIGGLAVASTVGWVTYYAVHATRRAVIHLKPERPPR